MHLHFNAFTDAPSIFFENFKDFQNSKCSLSLHISRADHSGKSCAQDLTSDYVSFWEIQEDANLKTTLKSARSYMS